MLNGRRLLQVVSRKNDRLRRLLIYHCQRKPSSKMLRCGICTSSGLTSNWRLHKRNGLTPVPRPRVNLRSFSSRRQIVQTRLCFHWNGMVILFSGTSCALPPDLCVQFIKLLASSIGKHILAGVQSALKSHNQVLRIQ